MKQNDSLSLAWLSRGDGSVVLGHGPFTPASKAPSDGIAFFKRSFSSEQSQAWQIPTRSEIIRSEEFSSRYRKVALVKIDWEAPDTIPFSRVFQEVMTSIRQGNIEKTVPVVTERAQSSQPVRDFFIHAMSRQRQPLRSYGWITGDEGFAGATPELLFSLEGKNLKTMALAGTARQDDEEVFEVDEKEIREHEYVAQTLLAKLADLGRVHRDERRVLRLASIVHFLTSIEVELDHEQDPEQLIRRLHPTPALGPLPRTEQTMSMLCGWRDRLGCPAEFGAPFGVWDKGRFEAIVAIRGIWWSGSEIFLPAGCGMIEASRLVNEWRELRLKRESVKKFLEA